MRDYKKIDAWKDADDLAVLVYQSVSRFPREELYGITSQIRRAAVSVAANIAEGSARESKREYLHFLYIARGSLTEVQYLVHLSSRLGYLAEGDQVDLESQIKAAFVRLHGLTQAVEREAGTVRKAVATLTSMAVISLCHLLRSPWS